MDPGNTRLLEIACAVGLMRPSADATPLLPNLIEETALILRRGVDPNATNHAGETALGSFAAAMRGNDRQQLEFANLLMSHGANPMLADKPLGTQISHTYSSFLVTNTLMAIAKAEKEGRGLRDEHGGCVLHYLAEVDPQLATWQLLEDVHTIGDGDLDALFFPPAMLNARRCDGYTPLDVLWLNGWRDPTRHSLTWNMTDAMIKCGADPFLPSVDGQCVFQEIQRLVQAGQVDPPMHVWGPLAAKWSHRSLTGNTGNAPSRTAAPRL